MGAKSCTIRRLFGWIKAVKPIAVAVAVAVIVIVVVVVIVLFAL